MAELATEEADETAEEPSPRREPTREVPWERSEEMTPVLMLIPPVVVWDVAIEARTATRRV